MRYRITIPKEEDLESGSIQKIQSIANSYIKQVFAGQLVSQTISPKENGEAQVTLRIFIDKETHEKIRGAKRSHPIILDSLFEISNSVDFRVLFLAKFRFSGVI